MILLENRADYRSLFDTSLFTQTSSESAALIWVETGQSDRSFTQAELLSLIHAQALSLKNLQIEAGTTVIIAHQDMLETIIHFLATLYIGAIPSIFPTLTEKLHADIYAENLANLASNSDCQLILTQSHLAPLLHELTQVRISTISALQLSRTNITLPRPIIADNTLAFLQYSSGTTGLQKGIAITHGALLNQLASLSTRLRLSPEDKVISWLPLYHDMGLIAGFLLPILQGIPLILMSPFDWVAHPAMLLKAISRYRATLCWQPNFAYVHLARRVRQQDTQDIDLSCIKMFINCSEPALINSQQLFFTRFEGIGIRQDQLGVSYAMAENTFAVTQTDPAQIINPQPPSPDSAHKSFSVVASCGPALPGTEIRILDAQGISLSEGQIGEISIRSNSLFMGYHKRNDLPARGPDGWYNTGDSGYLMDGDLYVCGRLKDTIIHAGKTIYPHDIEIIANDHPDVHAGRCVVFGIPDEHNGTEAIVLLLERKPDQFNDPAEIQRSIRQDISARTGLNLQRVEIVPARWLIKTSSGKISRSACRQRWLVAQNASER